jgi:hypothetical protein
MTRGNKYEDETSSPMTGHAGMFVCRKLIRKGWFAALTASGSRGLDLPARRADAPVSPDTRVNTGHDSFLWSRKKDGTICYRAAGEKLLLEV